MSIRDASQIEDFAAPLAESSRNIQNSQTEIDALCDVGSLFYERGWSVGTSSNYSVVVNRDPLQVLITASGRDKRSLGQDDFVVVDGQGHAPAGHPAKPSAETLLHIAAAKNPNVGAVLHTHSIWGTILSDLYFPEGGFAIEGYEMLKGLAGVTTHEHRLWLEIFENTQDIPVLARQVVDRMADQKRPLRHGYLIRRHGLYTWGRDLNEARRHVEIFEFLFETLGRRLNLTRR